MKLLTSTGDSPKRIMRDKIQHDPSDFRFNFKEWLINPDVSNDITVENDSITIRKFKPNVWIIKSQYKLSTGTDTTGICAKTKNLQVAITGLSDKKSTIFNTKYTHHSVVGGSGATNGVCWGVCILPWAQPSSWVGDSYPEEGMLRGELPFTGYVWDALTLNDGTTCETGSQILLRCDGGGYNQYGIVNDTTCRTVLPDWLKFPTPYANWELAITLFTGNTDVRDSDGYIDISGKPITISLLSEVGTDPSSIEVWEILDGEGNTVYHKGRTIENCLLRYGMARYVSDERPYYPLDNGDIAITGASAPDSFIKLPEIVDLFEPGKIETVKWNCKLTPEQWAPIKKYYETNGICVRGDTQKRSQCIGLFMNSNISGSFIFRPKEYSLSSEMIFASTGITSMHCDFSEGTVTSGNQMFKGMNDLEELTFEGFGILSHDYSGMFEFCHKLKSIPEGLLRWGEYGANMSCQVSYMLEYSAIEEVPDFKGNGFVANPYISQFLNGAQLKVFNPVIDMKLVYPNVDANKAFSCGSVEYIKLKNLGNGKWNFVDDNTYSYQNGCMKALNAECVAYLFENLMDNSEGETPWVIRCPNEWSDKITADHISSAKAKNWEVYINGVKQ